MAEWFVRQAVRFEFNARVRQLISGLQDAVGSGDYASDLVSKSDIESYGQYPLSVAIAEEILGPDPTTADVDTFSIHGYSQGGTRAQLVSMYYAYVHELRFRTVTFGSTGSQCFTYKGKTLGRGDSWRGFLDPSQSHDDHIVGFYDALDPYAQSLDYNVGLRCRYGTTNITDRTALDYCSLLVGKGLDVLGALSSSDIVRCTYFTHSSAWQGRVTDPSSAVYFRADGTTDGMCERMPVISEDGDLCQPNGTPYDFILFALFFIAIPSFVVLLLIVCTIRAVCIGCGSCVACVGMACCCCCGGGGDGRKVQKCCYTVYEDASMCPPLLCLCNAPPSHPIKDSDMKSCVCPPESDAGCCNRMCCFCGRPCTYCGIPCCPPGAPPAKHQPQSAVGQRMPNASHV